MKSLSLFIASVLLFSQSFAHAGESAREVILKEKQKQALIVHFQKQIAKHKEMSLEEIRADITQRIDQNRAALAKRSGADLSGFDRMAMESLDQLKQIEDKQTILDLENAYLQNALSSTVYIFAVTRFVYSEGWSEFKNESTGEKIGFLATGVIWLPIVLAIDLVLLPFEIWMTIDEMSY